MYPEGHFGFEAVTVLVVLPFVQTIDVVLEVAEPPILLLTVPCTPAVVGFLVLVAEPEITGAFDGDALGAGFLEGVSVGVGFGLPET